VTWICKEFAEDILILLMDFAFEKHGCFFFQSNAI